MTTFTIAASRGEAPCRANTAMYDYVGYPTEGEATTGEYSEVMDACRNLCESCPLFAACLTRAVTGPDLEGFVAGTTAKDRTRLKQLLRLDPEPLNVGRAAGTDNRVRVPRWRIEEAILRNPGAQVKVIATEVKCSWHTVDRYLKVRDHSPAVLPQSVSPETVGELYAATVA